MPWISPLLLASLLLLSACDRPGSSATPSSSDEDRSAIHVPRANDADDSGTHSEVVLQDLAGHEVRPFADSAAQPTVFVFVRTDCPISNRYAPKVRELFETYGEDQISMFLVYPSTDESSDLIRRHLEEFDYSAPALRDPQRQLVARAGAEVTPEAAVFDTDGALVYSGRIDDTFQSFSSQRAAPTVDDLKDAIEAVLNGRKPAVERQPAVGCAIPTA